MKMVTEEIRAMIPTLQETRKLTKENLHYKEKIIKVVNTINAKIRETAENGDSLLKMSIHVDSRISSELQEAIRELYYQYYIEALESCATNEIIYITLSWKEN